MRDLRNQDDDQSKKHWKFVEDTAAKVGQWPLWKQAASLTATETSAEIDRALEDDGYSGSAFAAD